MMPWRVVIAVGDVVQTPDDHGQVEASTACGDQVRVMSGDRFPPRGESRLGKLMDAKLARVDLALLSALNLA